jgi:hypothetical protein
MLEKTFKEVQDRFVKNSDSLIKIDPIIREELEFNVDDDGSPRINFEAKLNDLKKLKKIYKNPLTVPEKYRTKSNRNKNSLNFSSITNSISLNESVTMDTPQTNLNSKRLLENLQKSFDSNDVSIKDS